MLDRKAPHGLAVPVSTVADRRGCPGPRATAEGIFQKAVLAAMAGAFASFAAWTKNEGLIFFLLSIGCYWLVSLRRRSGVGSSMAPWWYFLIGAMPGLLVVGYLKAFLAPPNDLAGQKLVQALHKMVEADRYIRIGKSLVTEALRLGDWWANPLLLLAILAIALRFRIDTLQSRPILLFLIFLALEAPGRSFQCQPERER